MVYINWSNWINAEFDLSCNSFCIGNSSINKKDQAKNMVSFYWVQRKYSANEYVYDMLEIFN